MNKILNLCLSVSIFFPLQGWEQGCLGLPADGTGFGKGGDLREASSAAHAWLKRNIRNPLSSPHADCGAWTLWGGRGCRVQVLSPPAQGDGPLPIILLGWMALLRESCLQREVLWCHFSWILPLSAAQEQGPGMWVCSPLLS